MMKNEKTNSIGINKWAGNQGIELVWATGDGDGAWSLWKREDGARAIATNGDPVFEGEDGFEEAWISGIRGTNVIFVRPRRA